MGESEGKALITSTLDILYFKKGEDKFSEELDVVSFTRSQRELKMLMHSMMNEHQRFLAPYQKLNAISLLSDSESNNSDDLAFSKIPKMLSKADGKQRHREAINQFFVGNFSKIIAA